MEKKIGLIIYITLIGQGPWLIYWSITAKQESFASKLPAIVTVDWQHLIV